MNTRMDSVNDRYDPVEGCPMAEHSPQIIVLQPEGCLDTVTSQAFLAELEQALGQTDSAVIVDLLRVNTVEPAGINALLTAIKWAADQSKALSICAMSLETRAALESEWDGYWMTNLGKRVEFCQQEFERFLQSSSWAKQRTDEAQAIANKDVPLPLGSRVMPYTTDSELRTQQTA